MPSTPHDPATESRLAGGRPRQPSQKPVVPAPRALSACQLSWHSLTTSAARAAEVGVSEASLFSGLPSVVLYLLSHSTSFGTTPAGRSAAEEAEAASGSSASTTMILWSSSPIHSSVTTPNQRGGGGGEGVEGGLTLVDEKTNPGRYFPSVLPSPLRVHR
mgnify:CR=1 FL=1